MRENGFLIENGVLKSYDGEERNVTIPEGVTHIGNNAFHFNRDLITLTIPEGVVSIGNSAFSFCARLNRINFPQSLTHIGENAFYFCGRLSKITLPQGVTEIGNNAFSGTPIEMIELPGGITEISTELFCNCEYLETVILPKGLVKIGHSAFKSCKTLFSVDLPESLVYIEDDAFNGCGSLGSIKIPHSVKEIGCNAFYGCSRLFSVTLPKGLTKISSGLFGECQLLKNIDIPQGVIEIGFDGFYRCVKLESVKIPDGVKKIGENAFWGCKSLKAVDIPDTVRVIESKAFAWCNSLEKIEIPESVKRIGNSAFRGCDLLRDERGFIIIRNVLYGYCGKVDHLVIPDEVACMDETSVVDDKKVSKLTIPHQSIVLRERAFSSFLGLKYIIAPNIPLKRFKKRTTKRFAAMGFMSAPQLYTDEAIKTAYERYMVLHRMKLLPLIFKDDLVQGLKIYGDMGKITVENFENEYFIPATEAKAIQCVSFLLDWKGKNLSQEDIEKQLKREIRRIEREAYKDPFNITDMKKLWRFKKLFDGTVEITGYKGQETDVVIPERIGDSVVSSIGKFAFSPKNPRIDVLDMWSLLRIASVTIPESVKGICDNAFLGCQSLNSVKLPEGLEYIGKYSFGNCNSLSKISIPKELTLIDKLAFDGCFHITLKVHKGSHSHQFARTNGFNYEEE